MRNRLIIAAFFLSLAVPVYSRPAFVPPSMGELSLRLISPVYLGGGLHQTRTGTPLGVVVNPAAAAGIQRITLDANYTFMYGLQTGMAGNASAAASGGANAVNAGASFPSRFGVFSVGAGFVETGKYSGTAMDSGIWGRLHAAFSKQLYSDLWFGFAVDGGFGTLDGRFQGGGALSAGFLHFPKNAGPLKNFRWGGSFSGLGYRYGSSSRGYMNAIPGNLTPAAGMAFDPVDREKFRITFRTDVRVPSLTDVWFGLAGDFYFGQYARLSLSSSVAVRDAFEGAWQTVIPSVTLGAHFPLNRKKESEADIRTTEMDVQFAAAPLYAGVWAFSAGTTLPFGVRDENPPKTVVDFDSTRYFSPNYDGVQDDILIPYTVEDERFITAYEWEIRDSANNTVRRYVNKEERPENETFKNLGSRLFAPKTGTPLPENIRWDGITDLGAPAQDGSYSLYLSFSDDNGNTSESGPYSIVLDSRAPELTLKSPEGTDLVFSPDGDGLKDSFLIRQSGSEEHLWEAAVTDAAGRSVRTYAWADASLGRMEWDGRSDNGEIVPDGVYRYSVFATDLAGNPAEASIDNIIVDTRQPRMALAIDSAVFSPGTAGGVKSVTFSPEVSVKSGMVEWLLEIVDDSGQRVRSWSYRESPVLPADVEFDGRRDGGGFIGEGRYRGRLSLVYQNGYQHSVESPVFVADTTAPSARTSVNWDVFAPQSGSARSEVSITQSASSEPGWEGTMFSGSKPVKTWSWVGNPPKTLVWDGRDAEGRLVPDGTYNYVLSATDRAGNRGSSSPVSIRVDTSSVEASVTASRDVFAPTGNGINDTVNLFLKADTASAIADWELTVREGPASGAVLRGWSGKSSLPARVEWDGRSEGGRTVPDGFYTAALRVNYVKGISASSSTGTIEVDTLAPDIQASLPEMLFSPDADGSKDVLNIVQSSSKEEYFEASFLNDRKEKVRSFLWKDVLEDFQWDGTDDSGNRLPDGTYSYVVAGVDTAGNRSEVRISGIKVDTAPTPVYLTAAKANIRAGETNAAAMQSFAAVVPNKSGIESWTLDVVGEDGNAVWNRSGGEMLPERFSWNGTDNAGRIVEGNFSGLLTVHYRKGSAPQASSRPFVVDASPPVVRLDMTPQPFTPDDDNVDDELLISILVQDSSRIGEWSMDIEDPRGRPFISFSGRGLPSEQILWDGRSSRGDLVESAEDYPFVLSVTDALGQSTVVEGEIAVGILIIKEGDRLKIRLSNITFEPNSPRLTLEGERGKKNVEVLDRLAEIMKKFSRYRILVEGHAVSLKWDNPEAARQEQENILLPLSFSRAQTVLNELRARGIASSRMTADGIGGARPIVPHGNLEERWRNRRVEFFLDK